MKLYVWENVLRSWGDGIMFAWADNVEQAREKILEKAAIKDGQAPQEVLEDFRAMLDDEKAKSIFLAPVRYDYDEGELAYKYTILEYVAYTIIPDLMKEPREIDSPEGWLIHGSD